MTPWPKHPIIHEINTRVWLGELARRLGRSVTLADVPADAWDALAGLGFDAVWLMGVWERSPRGRDIALANAGLMEEFRRALPDLGPEDVAGSPYCIRNYLVDPALGGAAGLAAARAELSRRGLRLVLDFVPNHVAPDHPWTTDHPEYFIGGDGEGERDPAAFVEVNGKFLALGRDPFFPAWPDVVQLNAFNPDLRRSVAAILSGIAKQCDGVRCDMAMLFLNQVFAKTWGGKAGPVPESEYWAEVISAVRRERPDFLFIAEAYWDLEGELHRHGFDYCYDKRLYDRLAADSVEPVRQHLAADLAYQEKLIRFLENHDEPRAAAAFPGPKSLAAAVAVITLPGAKLWHEGQLDGYAVRLPVFLLRRPEEAPNPETRKFHQALLAVAARGRICSGEWRLCDCMGWPDNESHRNLLAWCWRDGEKRHVIIINYSAAPSQARVRLPWDDLGGAAWKLDDLLAGRVFDRAGDEMRDEGLYVELAPWQSHIFEFRR